MVLSIHLGYLNNITITIMAFCKLNYTFYCTSEMKRKNKRKNLIGSLPCHSPPKCPICKKPHGGYPF